MKRRWRMIYLMLPLVLLWLSGCSTLGYYMQAINGHLDIVSHERPIDEILADKNTAPELKKRLALALEARRFASKEMQLPDNDSYKEYAALDRPYVVWTVVATPAYSIKPKQWCFMVVGCLSYRGYFAKADADELAQDLKQQGMDVALSGTIAYSTLGYFDDPLVSSMLKYDDATLIGTIFHELAHQRIHVDGDTSFNEAFAMAVEHEGLRRWYKKQGNEQRYEKYLVQQQRKYEFYRMLMRTRQALKTAFEQETTPQGKQTAKQRIYAQLRAEYQTWSEAKAFHGFDKWMQRDLNNADLSLVATYQDLVPSFEGMLASVHGQIGEFYQLVQSLGAKDKKDRALLLAAYTNPGQAASLQTQSQTQKPD